MNQNNRRNVPSTRDKMSLVVSGLVPQIAHILLCKAESGIALFIPTRAKILTRGIQQTLCYSTVDYRKVFPLNLNCTPLIEFSLAKKLYPFHTVAIHKV